MELELVIGSSIHTTHLTPGSINFNDQLDARTALSFQLIMPATDTRPTVGQEVYLEAGADYTYFPKSGIGNEDFDGSTAHTGTAGYTWLDDYWNAYANTTEGTVAIDSNKLTFTNSTAGGGSLYSVAQARLGTWSSNAIPLDADTNYRIAVDINSALSTVNGYGALAKLYAGVSSSMVAIGNLGSYVLGTKTTTVTRDYATTSSMFMDIYLSLYAAPGTVSFSNLALESYEKNRVFGGTLDNFTETCYPMTNTVQLYCQCVDYTQMTGKRLVYKSYPSSGIGDYDSIATTESFTGDGSNRAFVLSYPLTTDPTVTVNGIGASVGVKGTATSTKGYYYTPSSYLILSNTSNSALATTDTLGVVYTAIVGLPAYDADIINDINTNFLDSEGIDTTTFVSTGMRIPEIHFNYTPANEAINRVAEAAGRSWYIDPWKRLHYFARTENPAPFDITSTSDNWRSLTVTHNRDKYRNKQYVLNANGYAMKTESVYGDGKTRAFTLASPVYATPAITLNGVYTADVGVYGVATSTVGYLWQKESNFITSCATNSALASTDWLTVNYMGLNPIVAVSMDGEEIATRAAIESNSGKYEESISNNVSYTAGAALEFGNSILSKYGKPLEVISFETDSDGLAAGQLIKVVVPNNNLDGLYLITNVTARDVGMQIMRYRATAVSGVDRGGWVSFFRSLVNNGNLAYTEPYDNLLQATMISASGNLQIEDSVTIDVTVIGVAYIGYGVIDTAEVS